ncbi:hypothetical protein [Streptomyces cylindrosporus]|uniref:Uncharacterized protein n=1 Tax=Streptomyces cylindrosporus TaxID=2927583 RepID=A0ABS9YPB4_9ACTN|nr:hypothetical protein [Streptomyces cylindrosporus]MCI3279112.1 hypothetical protein [Streptomyces cylindrosporus]
MDMDALMTREGMRTTTSEQRDTWVNDAVQIRQMAQIIQARIANTHVDGDNGQGPARRRAAKVSRRWRRAARLVEKAAAEIEAADAVYLREVLELPDRRAKDLERKADRKNRLGLATGAVHEQVTNSLTTSAATLAGPPPVGNPQVTPAQQPIQYTNPHAFPLGPTGHTVPVPNIGDLFNQEAM